VFTAYPLRTAWERGRAAGGGALQAAEAHPNRALALLLALGLLLRVPFLGSTGFPVDVHDFQAWALHLADVGPGRFYSPGYFADILPGYLWWLWFAGSWAKALSLGIDSLGFLLLLKLPVLAASLAAGALLFAWARSRLGVLPACGAAALYLANPALIFVGPVWGQIDGLAAALLFAGTVALLSGRLEWALPLGVAAALTKPQVAVVAPLWLAILVAPYLRRAAQGAVARPSLRRWALALAGALATAFVILAPFHLGPAALLRQLNSAVSVYPFTSVGALNFWNMPWVAMWKTDQTHFGPLTLQLWGLGLFGASALTILIAWVRRPTATMAMAASGAVLLAFFLLPTRIHERYLIPALVFLAALAVTRPRWLLLYGAVSGSLYLNLLRVYTDPLYQTGMHRPPVLNNLLEAPGMWIISLALLACLGALLFALVAAPQTVEEPNAARRAFPARVPPPMPATSSRPQVARLPWTRRELLILAGLLVLVFGLREFRLADPPAPVFDEVYHPRTAMEYLAFLRYGNRDEVYEWTHPPLAKELMAVGVALWGNHRVVHRWRENIDGDRFVADPRHRLYWATQDAMLVSADARNGHLLGRRPLPAAPTALAVSPAGELGVALADGSTLFGSDAALRPRGRLEQPARVLSASGNNWWALAVDGLSVYRSADGGSWERVLQANDPAEALVAGPNNEVWLGGPRGLSVWDPSGRLIQDLGGTAVTFLAYNPTEVEGETRVFAARPDGLDVYDAPRHVFRRQIKMPPPAPTPTPLVLNSHAHLLYVSTADAVEVVDLIGDVRFARIPAPAGTLALDADASRPDSRNQVYVWSAGPRQLAQIDCGHNAFGWRLPGVLMAALLALGLYLLTRDLLASVRAARVAGFLVAFDFMTFSQSRIGTPDIYVAAFLVFAYWGVYRALNAAGRRQAAWFTGAGLALGAACASKWIGVYGAAALLAGTAVWVSLHRDLRARVVPLAGQVAVTLVALPIAIYLASYSLYFASGHSFADFLTLQRSMYHYHATLDAPHPAGSPWWSWPLVLKPVWFYSHAVQTDRGPATAVIYDGGNLAIWWPTVPALIGLTLLAWRRRVATWGVPPWAALGQWLPWVRVTRVTFLYHFFSVVPFGMAAIAFWVDRGLRHRRWRNWVIAYLALVVVLFVLIYPWISGIPIRDQDLANYQWLTSWAYDFQFYPSRK